MDFRDLHRQFRELKRGEYLNQTDADKLAETWESAISPTGADRSERYAVCFADGTPTGTLAPRWLCHLVGLRHRAVEIGFVTESGLIALQRRSVTKADWPDALDMTVAGHLVENDEFLVGAWREIEEEIGLSAARKGEWLMEGDLTPLGEPYFSLDIDPNRVPPRYNAEVRQIYIGTLKGAALGALRFADGEADGLLLVPPEVAWRLLASPDEKIASGMRYTLPRMLDWLEKREGAIHRLTQIDTD